MRLPPPPHLNPSSSMIPDPEIENLTAVVQDAITEAGKGNLARGYSLLWDGLKYAQDTQNAGEAWGSELVERYQQALDHYCVTYGVRLE